MSDKKKNKYRRELAEAKKRIKELEKETEDSPQGVVDILNQHFWDLV